MKRGSYKTGTAKISWAQELNKQQNIKETVKIAGKTKKMGKRRARKSEARVVAKSPVINIFYQAMQKF